MEKITCPKCDSEVKSKKRWGVVTYTCVQCEYVWYEKKKARCPKCSSKKIGFRKAWGTEYQTCFDCNYKVKVDKQQYYYEGDVDEYKKGLIEKIREVL